MGCAICLDDFNQVDGEAKRATALPCGHIFHHECLQAWFYGPTAAATHRPNHQQRCPLCAGATDPRKMVKLFPSDGDDLDKYLSGQQQWECVRLREEDADDNRNLKQLLADLMDFNTAVQAYVMATHGVRCDVMVKSGVKVRRLFLDLAKDTQPVHKDALLKSMDSLENAASCFSTMFNDLSRRCRKNRQLQLELLKEKASLDKESAAAKTMSDIAAGKLREVEVMSTEMDKRIQEVSVRQEQATEKLHFLAMKDLHLKGKEQRLDDEKLKMNLETTLKLTNMKRRMEEEMQDMRHKMDQALKKSAEVERERQAAHKKSCQLAEQLQQMQQRLKGRKQGAGSGPLNAVVGNAEAMERRIKALEARNKSMEEQLRKANIITPEHRLAHNSHRRTNAGSIDLTRSSSPLGSDINTSPATPLDGFDLGSQASSSTVGATAGSSPSVQRKGKKRARASLSVEPERLDDEMDEALFPMPGFGSLQMPGQRAHRPLILDPMTQASVSTKATEPTYLKVPTGAPNQSPTPLKAPASNGAAVSSATKEHRSPTRKGVDDRNGKKRRRASTPTAAGSTSNPSGASNTGGTSKTGDANKTNRYDWLNKTNGIALGPKRRSKAS